MGQWLGVLDADDEQILLVNAAGCSRIIGLRSVTYIEVIQEGTNDLEAIGALCGSEGLVMSSKLHSEKDLNVKFSGKFGGMCCS